MEIYTKLTKICKTKQNVDLKTMCSIHIGGVGAYVCYPSNVGELKRLIKFLQKNQLEYFIIGNGSNVVFEDGGYSAVLISLREINYFKTNGNIITVGAGLNLFALNYLCKTEGRGGLEWSYGIPASVGGAVFMNAGAFGGEIKDYIKNVWVISKNKVKKYTKDEMCFSYRGSIIQKTKEIIIQVSFCLQKMEPEKIDKLQKQIFAFRKCCQPYGFYNAGSIFKKSKGISAGKTIDKLGLKSVKIGDIQISEIHANFFVNLGNGTSRDLHQLIENTKKVVFEKEGIKLEEEIIFVGNKGNCL